MAAAGVALLVGRDGSTGWRGARVVAVAAVTVGAWWVLRRAGTIWRGLAAVTAGLLATAVGVGIALPHVTKVGFTVVSLAGLACLAAGLVLVVGGTGTLLRATRPWWRIPIVVALLVAAYAVVFILGVAVAATNVPRTAVGLETPGAHGLAYEDVTFSTADGVALSGWYVPSRNGAAVVLLHGAGSTRSAVLRTRSCWPTTASACCSTTPVATVAARGEPWTSAGTATWTWQPPSTSWPVRPACEPGRVAALGLSMGGEEALGAAASDPRIRAVVAEGATTRVAGDKAWLSDVHGVRGWVQEQLDRAMYATADVLTAASPPIRLQDAVARTSPRPILLITAGAVPDEGHAAAHIQAGSPATVQVWTASGAGHTRSLAVHPAEWEDRVVSFLAHALGLP